MKNSLKHILSILTCVTLTAALAFPVQAAGVSSIRMGSYKGNTLAVGERSGLILAPVGTEYTVIPMDLDRTSPHSQMCPPLKPQSGQWRTGGILPATSRR